MLGRLVLMVALGCSLASPAWAGRTADGREWPPDPAKYDKPGTPIGGGLAVGDVLAKENADQAKDLLPPEILKHYKMGDYSNPIVSWPTGIFYFDKSFEEATKQNAGKYDLAPEGAIVDKATGKQPEYVYGLPFPDLKEGDPQAGLKAVWNSFYAWWNNGDGLFNSLLVWVSPGGKEREAYIDIRYQWYAAQAPKYRRPNPQNFLSQSLNLVTKPADLQGTAALMYRYLDPGKRDAAWTYVPALRRVRAISPSNRSDGFLGSDLSQDDAQYFDAKPEDFQWKTIGLRAGLRIVDPESVRGLGGENKYQPDTNGFRTIWDKEVPAARYLQPGWDGTGLAWAPVSAALAKRKFWVVEGVPKDRYYLYGRIELWIDAESFEGAWNRKFSWKGELLNTYQVTAYLNHPTQRPGDPDVEWFWSSSHAWNCAENMMLDRATLTGLRASLTAPLDRRVKHDIEQTFDLQALSRGGK